MNQLYTKSAKEVFPIGQWTWWIWGLYDVVDWKKVKVSNYTDKEDVDAMGYAFDNGINYIDVCHHYGWWKSMPLVKQALEWRKKDDFFINGKLEMDYTSLDQIKSSAYRYCEALCIDYIDSFQFHAPLTHIHHKSAVEQVKKLQEEWIVRHVSISNFNQEQIQDLLDLDMHPITHEVYYNLATRFNEEYWIIKKWYRHDIKAIAYKPLDRNALSWTKIPLLKSLSEKYEKTENQILLNRIVRGNWFRTLTKSSNKKRIQENIDAAWFWMNSEDVQALNKRRPEGYKTPLVDRDWNSPELPRAWKVG